MKPLILVACFLPLGIIYIVMKLAVWVSVVNAENNNKLSFITIHIIAIGDRHAIKTNGFINLYTSLAMLVAFLKLTIK